MSFTKVRNFLFLLWVCLTLVLFGLLFYFLKLYQQAKNAPVQVKEVLVEVEKVVEVEKKAPILYAQHRQHDIRKTSKGLDLLTHLNVQDGEALASVEKKRPEAYFAEYQLNVTRPKPAQIQSDLQLANPQLLTILPGLSEMLPTAKVSPFYEQIYNNKVKRLRGDLLTLDRLITTHNFYDLQTILDLTHPKTGRKVLLIQSEMDVVADGSDGDRLPVMPEEIVNSTHYQFSTSYWWPKMTDQPNPMVQGFENRIQKAQEELKSGAVDEKRKAWLLKRIEMLKGQIKEGKAHSFLIAEHDPFIVMPTQMIVDRKHSHSPRAGDYACVVYQNKVYPAIVGDAGPTYKMGEASLRIAKELNAKASPYHRPVSDLTVTYLVFSQSRGDRQPPNYQDWHDQCAQLLQEIGGLGDAVSLHQWSNTLPSLPEEPLDPEEKDTRQENEGVRGESENNSANPVKGQNESGE